MTGKKQSSDYKNPLFSPKKAEMSCRSLKANGDWANLFNVPAETAVVFYTVNDEECLAFVFVPRRIQPKIFVIAKSGKNLDEKIKRFCAGLLKFDPAFKSQAGELYTPLLKNFENEIGDAKNLIIISDGALRELPFQTPDSVDIRDL